jgi:hypothetical protein
VCRVSKEQTHLVVRKLVGREPQANLGSSSVKRVRGVDQVAAVPISTDRSQMQRYVKELQAVPDRHGVLAADGSGVRLEGVGGAHDATLRG